MDDVMMVSGEIKEEDDVTGIGRGESETETQMRLTERKRGVQSSGKVKHIETNDQLFTGLSNDYFLIALIAVINFLTAC